MPWLCPFVFCSSAWAANTMRITATGTGAADEGEAGLQPLRVDADTVLHELQKVNHQPVVYIAQHLDVDLATVSSALQSYAVFQSECRALGARS